MRRGQAVFVSLLVAFLISVPWLGLKEFYSRGEAREALVAQSMLRDGKWLVGEGYGGAVPSKPPFTHWLAAAASAVPGEVSEFTARLPSALFFCLFAGYFAWFVGARRSPQEGLLAAVLLSTCIEWGRAGVTARVDLILAALIASGLFLFLDWQRQGLKAVPVLAILCFSAAVLTKGPVALLLPAAICGLFLLMEGTAFFKAVWACTRLFLPTLIVAGIWYGAAWLEGGDAFRDKFWEENIARFSGTMEEEAHVHSPFYLYATLALGLFPWLLALIPAWIAGCRKGLSAGLWAKWQGLDSFGRFCWLVLLIFLVFFSIPASKRSVYLLPAYPFAASLMAAQILRFAGRGDLPGQRILFCFAAGLSALLALIVTGLCLLLKAGFLVASSAYVEGASSAFYWNELLVFCNSRSVGVLACFALGLLSLLAVRKTRECGRLVEWSAGLLCALMLVLNASLLPHFANAVSVKPFALLHARDIPGGASLFSYGNEFYGLSFYLGRRIDRYNQTMRSGDFVFLYQNNLERLGKELPAGYELRVIRVSERGVEHPKRKLAMAELRLAAQTP